MSFPCGSRPVFNKEEYFRGDEILDSITMPKRPTPYIFLEGLRKTGKSSVLERLVHLTKIGEYPKGGEHYLAVRLTLELEVVESLLGHLCSEINEIIMPEQSVDVSLGLSQIVQVACSCVDHLFLLLDECYYLFLQGYEEMRKFFIDVIELVQSPGRPSNLSIIIADTPKFKEDLKQLKAESPVIFKLYQQFIHTVTLGPLNPSETKEMLKKGFEEAYGHPLVPDGIETELLHHVSTIPVEVQIIADYFNEHCIVGDDTWRNLAGSIAELISNNSEYRQNIYDQLLDEQHLAPHEHSFLLSVACRQLDQDAESSLLRWGALNSTGRGLCIRLQEFGLVRRAGSPEYSERQGQDDSTEFAIASEPILLILEQHISRLGAAFNPYLFERDLPPATRAIFNRPPEKIIIHQLSDMKFGVFMPNFVYGDVRNPMADTVAQDYLDWVSRQDEKPHFIILTGNLTSAADSWEMAALQKFLVELQNNCIQEIPDVKHQAGQILVVPGILDHDVVDQWKMLKAKEDVEKVCSIEIDQVSGLKEVLNRSGVSHPFVEKTIPIDSNRYYISGNSSLIFFDSVGLMFLLMDSGELLCDTQIEPGSKAFKKKEALISQLGEHMEKVRKHRPLESTDFDSEFEQNLEFLQSIQSASLGHISTLNLQELGTNLPRVRTRHTQETSKQGNLAYPIHKLGIAVCQHNINPIPSNTMIADTEFKDIDFLSPTELKLLLNSEDFDMLMHGTPAFALTKEITNIMRYTGENYSGSFYTLSSGTMSYVDGSPQRVRRVPSFGKYEISRDESGYPRVKYGVVQEWYTLKRNAFIRQPGVKIYLQNELEEDF